MTNIYQPTPANLDLAAQAIKDGKLVSFPTDTVYGLGADVYNSSAVANIFKAKERPLFDPLISHVADIDFLKEYVETDDRAVALAKQFWPGPQTKDHKRKDNRPFPKGRGGCLLLFIKSKLIQFHGRGGNLRIGRVRNHRKRRDFHGHTVLCGTIITCHDSVSALRGFYTLGASRMG